MKTYLITKCNFNSSDILNLPIYCIIVNSNLKNDTYFIEK